MSFKLPVSINQCASKDEKFHRRGVWLARVSRLIHEPGSELLSVPFGKPRCASTKFHYIAAYEIWFLLNPLTHKSFLRGSKRKREKGEIRNYRVMHEYSFVGCFVREIKRSHNPGSYAKCQDFREESIVDTSKNNIGFFEGKRGHRDKFA